MRAHPDMRPIRTHIREQSRWAQKVVIATDTDAAGDAIAYGIANQLNRFDVSLLRTRLQGLSPGLIEKNIKAAQVLDQNGLLQRLKNRYLVSKELQKIPWSLPDKFILPTLALLSIQFNDQRCKWFIDQDGYKYQMPDGINMRSSNSIKARDSLSTVTKFDIYPPLTTATAIELFEEITEKLSFEELQESLYQLFTTLPKSIGTGLISYPRTASKGFWAETWSQFRRQWTKTNSLETFRPSPIQPTPRSMAVHESIHPLELNNTLDQVRPHLRKFQYELYSHLYKYHKKLLSAPASYQASVLRTTDERKRLYSLNSPINSEPRQKKLQPYISIGELANQIMEYKVLRPSQAGSFMDYMLENSLITIDTFGNVRTGTGLETLYYDIRSLSSLKRLIDYIKSNIDQTVNPDMISKFADDILDNKGSISNNPI